MDAAAKLDLATAPTPSLPALGWAMVRIGVVSFGGNNALLMSSVIVDQRRWLTEDQFNQSVALATISPGGNSSNLSFEVGREIRGLAGGIVSYLSMALPGMVLIVVLTTWAVVNSKNRYVEGLLNGAQAGVVAMVIMIGYRLGRKVLGSKLSWALALLIFIVVAIFRIPMIIAVPPVVGLGYFLARRGDGRADDGRAAA
jgi:chromate transporter